MVIPLPARPAWRRLPVGPPGRRGRAPLIQPSVSQTLPRSQSRLRSKFKHSLAIVVARLAHSQREEDHSETIHACGQPMQKSTTGRDHCTAMTAACRKYQTAWIPLSLPTIGFKHAHTKQQEYASTRVGHDIFQTSSTSDEALDLVAGPSQPDGTHPEDGPNFLHKRMAFAHTHHPHPLCDAATPAAFCIFLSTGRILFPGRIHERRQFFRLVGRLGMERMERLIVTGPHVNRAGPRRAGHERRPQVAISTCAFNEADFFQTLIERQEETIRELNTLYGKLGQLRSTQW